MNEHQLDDRQDGAQDGGARNGGARQDGPRPAAQRAQGVRPPVPAEAPRPPVDLRSEIQARARVVPVDQLQQGGTKFVRVINTEVLGQIVARAAQTLLEKHQVHLKAEEKAAMQQAARAEVTKLMNAHKRMAAAKAEEEERRRSLEGSVEQLQAEFRRALERLEAERQRQEEQGRARSEQVAALESQIGELSSALRDKGAALTREDTRPFLLDGKLDWTDPNFFWKSRLLNWVFLQNLDLRGRQLDPIAFLTEGGDPLGRTPEGGGAVGDLTPSDPERSGDEREVAAGERVADRAGGDASSLAEWLVKQL